MHRQSTPGVRPTVSTDIAAIKKILDATELFPSDLVDDMAADFFGDAPVQER